MNDQEKIWDKYQKIIQKQAPTSINIICNFIIFTSMITLLNFPRNSYIRYYYNNFNDNPIMFSIILAIAFAEPVANITSGICMKKGKNWARLLYSSFACIYIGSKIISIWNNSFPGKAGKFIAICLLVKTLTILFLFTPKSNKFFKATTPCTSIDEKHREEQNA
ncbi:MAG: hypothetical protein ACTFAL_15365 [Candidatus Electronema sp. V4]|uniref:hypothetical protein n=1 Tax=Candidatus Electronema sp. V4 TaxID=3454756 RepID=UPI00405562EB